MESRRGEAKAALIISTVWAGDFTGILPNPKQIGGVPAAIHDATGETAEVTAWLWSPRAGAMDLRGYHDAAGLNTYAEQLEALEITYEDYEPGFDKPEGVARTSELLLWALAATRRGRAYAARADNDA